MSPLRLVKPSDGHRLSVEELLSYFAPEYFDAIEQKARVMREQFHCPLTVPNYDAFKEVLFSYYGLYYQTYFNADLQKVLAAGDVMYWKHHAYEFATKHLGGQHAIFTAERNAMTGREGGMIAIIDAITDGIVKLHTESHIHTVFLDLISPGDFDTRLRLADEILKKFGPLLFPGETLLPHYFIGMNLEEFVKTFAAQLHALRKHWRY